MKLTSEETLKAENIHLKELLLNAEVRDFQTRRNELSQDKDSFLKSVLERLGKSDVNLDDVMIRDGELIIKEGG